MAQSKKIRVMLSSRCDDRFPASSEQTLSSIRAQLKHEIEGTLLFGKQVFDVWINEDAPPSDGLQDSWDACLQAVRDCDVLLVLSNGNAGWASGDGDIGICHAEYMEGLATARGKVRFIAMPNIATDSGLDAQATRNLRFQAFIEQQSPFRGGMVSTVEQLRSRVQEALLDALVVLTQRGVAAAASSRFDMGQALDWTRMDFRQRKRAMEAVLLQALNGGNTPASETYAIVPIAGLNVVVFAHAIPAAFTVAAARELVGKPFLHDHEHADLLNGAEGPLHLIACHRGATELQATALLGFADATVVSGSFGIFVADDIQKVQFAFLANCRDASQTRHALQRFREWLEQTGEAQALAKRAASRAKIVKIIADEFEGR
ncbi:hypothetical protein G1E_22895 [Pseudomonas sp. TJI-51]|uniref:DUF4062 domain-containing protein n=1 Tax=Pseudomonas sp. (strain TJI-51) TaxID=985010 RepID=UPI0001FB9128|nr:DUF4062 domain-containing protein [Pseudomonas sp. TJI-51]EGB96573.1 hypothetical protein G1E_22895 [Pseudomonas sp. TJI-51]